MKPPEYSQVLERPMMHRIRLNWQIKNPGSLYAAEAIGNNRYLLGGSAWRRREVPFSPDLAREAQGEAHFLNIGHNERREKIEQSMQFPSMVNVVVQIDDAHAIICCKYGQNTFNLVNTTSNDLIRTSDDTIGNGAYNAVYNDKQRELIVASRNGSLLFVDPDSLLIKHSIQLTSGDSRLWSLTLAQTDNRIITGDYDGSMYVVDSGKITHKVNLNDYADQIPEGQKQYANAVFGLTIGENNRIIVGTRWGQLIWFDPETVSPERIINVGREISFLAKNPKSNNILMGTREGKLFLLSQGQTGVMMEEICNIPPALQHDNAIWSISFSNQGECIVAFADGQVISLDISV